MSSNGFLSAPEINVRLSLRPLTALREAKVRRFGVDSLGKWRCWTRQGYQPVLLLRDKSIWLIDTAGLTVKPVNGPLAVLWCLRSDSDPQAWRRLRAWAQHSVY